MRPGAKAKISVTVDQTLVDHLDEGVRRKRYPSSGASLVPRLRLDFSVVIEAMDAAMGEGFSGLSVTDSIL